MKKLKSKERLPALPAVIQALTDRASQITAPLAQEPLAETDSAVAALAQAVQRDATARITYTLKKCLACNAHHLELTLSNYTVDKQVAANVIAQIDNTEQPTTA